MSHQQLDYQDKGTATYLNLEVQLWNMKEQKENT